MKVHLIAIGGSIMHNLALTLHSRGYLVTGSDDEIYEPAKSKLSSVGLLPKTEGWFADRIDESINLIILGMHGKKDNPELAKAIQLGIPIQSFPEYIAQEYKDKKQIVVTGSHGKTTTTAMLIHVFRKMELSADYLVGAQLEGFQNMVTISNAPYAIIEGDEYLSSCLDHRPKFMHYNPLITIITGVAWDHYNVFPTLQSYLKAFEDRVTAMHANNHVVFYQDDPALAQIISNHGDHLVKHPYREAEYHFENDAVSLIINKKKFPLQIFGKHFMQNIQAVLNASEILGLDLEKVANALQSFKGASKRMELIFSDQKQLRYRDFAHAPSKVKATLEAFRERYPMSKMLVILELHTYSSLSKEFIPQYRNVLDAADTTIIYYDPRAMELKNMPPLDPDFVKSAFNNESITITERLPELNDLIHKIQNDYQLILFLGSGQFGGLNLLTI